MNSKQSEDAKGILAERSKVPSVCIYVNRRQRIQFLKMVEETSDKNQFSYFYTQNSFLK